MDPNTLIMADDIRSNIKDGMTQFTDWLTANQGITNAMRVIGGLILLATAATFAIRKWKPDSQFAKIDISAVGIVCACILALFLVAPKSFAEVFSNVFGWMVELVYNVLQKIMGN